MVDGRAFIACFLSAKRLPAGNHALEDVTRDGGADGFAEAQVEVQDGLEPERFEHEAVGLLGAEV